MKGHNTYHYREALSLLLRTRWVSPYLLIPPLLAFMVYAEAFISANGGAFTLGQRSILAVWNGALLVSLIAGIKSCVFFSRFWGGEWFRNSLALPGSRSAGFWGPYLAMLTVASGVFLLTAAAVCGALPSSGSISLLHVAAESYLPVLWAVSMGAFLGIATSGVPGAMFFSALLLLGFVSGLPMVHIPQWLQFFIPPIGRLMSQGLRYPRALPQVVLLMGHSVVFLMAGRGLYSLGIKRR